MTIRRQFLAAFTLLAAATTFLGFNLVPAATAEGAQPKRYALVVVNEVRPPVATPGIIYVQVLAKNVSWSGAVEYHKGTPYPYFSSPERTYTVRVTWRHQTIQGKFKCKSPGLMEVHVKRNEKTNKIYFIPVQR